MSITRCQPSSGYSPVGAQWTTDAGVVDGNIQTAIGLDGELNHGLIRRGIGYIGPNRLRRPDCFTNRRDDTLCIVLIDIGNDNLAAARRDLPRDRLSNTGGAAGHNRDFPGKS